MQAQGMWSAGEADDNQRFLADLRALRDTAALEFDELAARAHYPNNVLKEAENGPSLPTLPILAAYVRACDGDVPEWEERWRRLGIESRADPSLPVRPAGASPAAVAGARAAVSVAPPDVYDPERIRAALRGSHGRQDGSARGIVSQPGPRRVEPDNTGPATADPRSPDGPAVWGTGTGWDETASWDTAAQPGTDTSWDTGTEASWDTAAQPGAGAGWDGFQRETGPGWDGAAAATDLSRTPTNGNHHAARADDESSDTAVMPVADAARADALHRDPFSADWLQDGEPTPPREPQSGSAERAEAQASSAATDNWFTPRATDPEQTWPPADTDPPAADTDNWFTPRERAEGGPASPQRPGPSPTQEQAIPRASWPAPAESPASDSPEAADRTASVLAPAAAAAPSRKIAGPVTPGPVVPPSRSRSDRLNPVRLLVVIVVAALIGSVLVLLLR